MKKEVKKLRHITRMVDRCESLGIDYDKAYSDYIDLVLSNNHFDYEKTDLWKYVENTPMVRNKVNYITNTVPKLITSIKSNGVKNPIEVEGNEVITGNQRLAIARKFGIKTLNCIDISDRPDRVRKRKRHEKIQ